MPGMNLDRSSSVGPVAGFGNETRHMLTKRMSGGDIGLGWVFWLASTHCLVGALLLALRRILFEIPCRAPGAKPCFLSPRLAGICSILFLRGVFRGTSFWGIRGEGLDRIGLVVGTYGLYYWTGWVKYLWFAVWLGTKGLHGMIHSSSFTTRMDISFFFLLDTWLGPAL